MIVVVDTNVLVWWVREVATPGQEDLIQRARWLFEAMATEDTELMITSITLAEFLAGAEPTQRSGLRREVETAFIVQPFDARAAERSAELRHLGRTLDHDDGRRPILKADVLIVASSRAGGAQRRSSHDAGLRSLAAKAGLDARDLPTSGPYLFS